MGEDQHRGGRAFPAVSSARNDEPETIGLKLFYALSEFIRIDKSLTFNLSTLNHQPPTLFLGSAQEGAEKMKSNSPKTTAANLEQRFDADEDVSDYFEFSRPFVWGGVRPAAGRKKLGNVRKQVMLSKLVAEKISRVAARKKQTFSATVEAAWASLR